MSADPAPHEISASDLAVDHQLAQIAGSFRFLLDITPVDADDVRDDFLAGRAPDPTFTYRELEADPEVLRTELANVELGRVEDPVLGQLLRAKHREMELQLDMLEARDTEDFLPLSVELYGGVSPSLRAQAEQLLAGITRTEPTDEPLDAEEFLALAEEEIARYRAEDPDLDMRAEIRPDVNGVMVSGDVLLIGPESKVQQARAQALLHHEVGTHLVTQANGSHQPIKVLGVGLAGYDETQEGLAVLAEIACGGLTAFRLRQLASPTPSTLMGWWVPLAWVTRWVPTSWWSRACARGRCTLLSGPMSSTSPETMTPLTSERISACMSRSGTWSR